VHVEDESAGCEAKTQQNTIVTSPVPPVTNFGVKGGIGKVTIVF